MNVRSASPSAHTWVVFAVQVVRAAALSAGALTVGGVADAAVRGDLPAMRAGLMPTAGFAVVAGLAAAAGVLLVARQEGREDVAWRSAAARAVLAGPVVSEARAGATVEALTGAVGQVAAYRAGFLGPTLGAFAAPVVVLGALAGGVSPALAAALAGFVVLVPLLLVAFMRVFRTANKAFGQASARLSAYYLESVTGLGMLTVLGAAGRRAEALAQVSERMRVQTMALLRRNLLVIVVTDATFGLGMVTVAVGLALRGLRDGQLSAGQVIAVLLMTVLLVEPVDKLGRSFYVAMIGRTHEARLRALIAQGPTTSPAPEPRHAEHAAPAPALSVRGLVVRRGEREVLRVDRLDVPAGSRVALVGPTGAGKSTLALVLQGLLEPEEGQVLIDGEVSTGPQRRALVAALAQRTYLFTGSVAQNLRLAAPRADDAELWDVLERARLADEVRALPGGIEAQVGEGGLALSGGQAQRVSLARAFAKDAPVLVLDEPTADLDAATRHLVEVSLAELSAHRTVVTVEHRLVGTLDADLVVVVEDGRVSAVGRPLQVLGRGGYYAHALAQDDDRSMEVAR
ncbi:MAG: ATP-binding cassette domain-containing protein [Cellulomonas sp.]|nr:ATP-binding cassette domain-containing protein [Cellulomonas sp.]